MARRENSSQEHRRRARFGRCCRVVIYAIDQGLSFLVSKLIELAQKTGENKETAAAILSMINLGL